MKKENKPTQKETDTNNDKHVDQNVYDFNPSQFTTEEELKKINKEKHKAKEEDIKKSDKDKK